MQDAGTTIVDAGDLLLHELRDLPRSTFSADEIKRLRDIVLYTENGEEKVQEALQMFLEMETAFPLKRLADHSQQASDVEKQREVNECGLALDICYGVRDKLKPQITPRTLFNIGENREATAREVFMRYDRDNSGAIDVAELGTMLHDLGLPRALAEQEFGLCKEKKAVSFQEFIEHYNSMLDTVRGVDRATLVPNLKGTSFVNPATGEVWGVYEYNTLMKCAELFYHDNPVEMSDEMIKECVVYVRGLKQAGHMNPKIAAKVEELVWHKDKYALFVLYKTHNDNCDYKTLNTYFHYRLESENRAPKHNYYSKQALEEYRQEQRQLWKELGPRRMSQKNQQKAHRVIRHLKKPRWLKLYETENFIRRKRLEIHEKEQLLRTATRESERPSTRSSQRSNTEDADATRVSKSRA